MDLRSIINTEAGDSASQKQAAPVTPIQTVPSRQSFREYSHPPQVTPNKHPQQDYGGSAQTGGPYTSPTVYQGPFSGRPPPPPPIQAPPQNDLRSPAGSYSAQSPYRPTPTSSTSGSQYPFPQSPIQHHQYQPPYQRDSFPQSNPPPPSHIPLQNPQNQASSTPQTPPVGIPGQPHPYLQHQRSQSSVSTPTSAQSQQPCYQYPQDSPGHFAQPPQPGRQQSQPGTPLGPPIVQRHSPAGFTQPTSPYQQRGTSSGPLATHSQTSPAPPQPASISRLPSTPSGYDSQRTSISEQRRSQSERERSLSVSPKTRLPSQPRGEVTIQQQHLQEITTNSAKRKMDDRDKIIDEPRHFGQDAKPQINGNHPNYKSATSSPQQPAKKRIRYTEPPIWAQSVRGKANLALSGNRMGSKVNGKQPASTALARNQPLAVKSEANGHSQVQAWTNRPGSQAPVAEDDPSAILGPWNKSINGTKPYEQMTRIVADWIYQNVVSRSDFGELESRGVEIEIEAKLGQIVDTQTNQRYRLPVLSECVIADMPHITFRSSMTETQHKSMNDFLNSKVAETHPELQKTPRVPINYLHRRETDKFYKLSEAGKSTLPPAVQEKLGRHVKVRVTHDQKTGNVIATIIKARLTDLHIYMPKSPLDCRISISLEMQYDGDMQELMNSQVEERSPDRNKDRLSYTQSVYQIDLTQVTQASTIKGVDQLEKSHELEIEVSTRAILQQGRLAANEEPNEYPALVEGFLDNMRILARVVPPPQY